MEKIAFIIGMLAGIPMGLIIAILIVTEDNN